MGRLRRPSWKPVGAVAVDWRLLADAPDFRRLWSGLALSILGRQFTLVAVSLQVFTVTHSSLAVGLVGLVQIGPLVVVGLWGGTLADTHDRRSLIMISQLLMALTSAALAVGAIGLQAPLWLIYLLTACTAGLLGIELPARQAVIPRLVPRQRLASGISLYQVVSQFAMVAGLAAAGLVIATLGLPAAYAIDALAFCGGVALVSRMRRLPPEPNDGRGGWQASLDGIRYALHRPVVMALMVADLDAMVFGLPRAVFPVLAVTVFRVGPSGLGLLYAAPAAGALLGSLFTGWVLLITRPGRVVIWSVGAWGAAIIVFGLMHSFAWALLFLAIGGTADMISAVFRHTVLQLSVTDAWRGRVSSLNAIPINVGPRLGDVEAGAVAAITSPQIAVLTGGAACIIGIAVLAFLVPSLRRYHLEQEP